MFVREKSKKIERNRFPVRVASSEGFQSQLGHAINLISAGVNVRVIKLSLGGFDTHEYQIQRHENLLEQLAKGVRQLRSDPFKTDNGRTL